MPPRVARGRGRGRGKAAAASDELPAEAPATRPPRDRNGESSQSTAANPSQVDMPASIITTPQHLLNEDAQPSPNSSPATIPTETPAPTPARPTQNESSEPIVAHTGKLSGRGGRPGVGGAEKSAAPSRFKPKNIRTDRRELEERARNENERLTAIAAENQREAVRLMRGRGRPLRGRGDAMGARPRPKTTASGIFSALPEMNKKAGGVRDMGGGGGGGGGLGPGRYFKNEGGGSSFTRFGGSSSGSGRGGQVSVPEPQYPDVDNNEKPVDIEAINLISDDEDDQVQYLGTRKAKAAVNNGKALKPVRLLREEHKERVLLVNTETTKIKQENDDDVPVVDEQRSSESAPKPREFKGVYQDPTDAQVKTEPGTTPEPTGPPAIKDSPDSKRKSQDALASSTPMVIDSASDGEALATATKEWKARPPTKKIAKKPVIQTEEDRAEYYRYQEDIRILTQELGGLQGNRGDKGKAKANDADGDVAMDDSTPAVSDDKHGRLYLFQFPPVLPELYNPAGPKPKTPLQIKRAEEEVAAKVKVKTEGKEDVAVVGAGSKGKGKLKDRVDLTGEPAPPIKLEEGIETAEEKAKREEEERKKKKRAEVVHEEGYVGKLVVRESGRVELQWGGTTLLVGRGAEAAFLTTGVVVNTVEIGPVGGGVPQATANGMGQIMGKFIVTPDWQSYASG